MVIEFTIAKALGTLVAVGACCLGVYGLTRQRHGDYDMGTPIVSAVSLVVAVLLFIIAALLFFK
ncbi:hypothetical protein HYT05_03025 [Candidatus Kaiserbacteria bacterium]|nr:hypothetical protein [Candidatus Kaiserbacteria bacterium]